MTPQTVQIQELIRQIDEALRKSIPRFPWLQSGEVDQQRQVLQQTRSYLVVLQQQTREAEDRPLTGSTAPGAMTGQSVETAQQVLQAVLQEMNYLRTNMLQPLRSDIDALQQRRSALAQEVQQLEAQRQQSLPAANQQFVSEFLQSSMQQLQENLTGQVANMLASLSAQTPADQPFLGDGDALSPAQRLQHMQRLQAQSDQLMMRLDSAIRIIFESMHANINSYEDSLEQGLNRMHTLGQQGEAMFSALVNRLAEHLGRETSTYLQSSLQVEAPSLGTSSPSVDTEIDQLLGELNGLNPASQTPDLDQSDLGLEPLDLSTDDAPLSFYDDEITLLQHHLDSTNAEDITLFQESLEPLPSISTAPPNAETEDLTEDLSSAMDLLNQLNGRGVEELSAGAESSKVDDSEADDELYQSLFGDRVEVEAGEVAVELTAEFVTPVEAVVETETPIAEIAELSDLFFSGMGDPAEVVEAEAAPPPEFSDAELSQSVEIFLLKVPDPEPATRSSRDPQGISATPLQEVTADPESTPPDAIASLSDLMGDPSTVSSQIDEQFEENTYEPAHPEESLLLDAAPPAMLDLEALPEDTRQLLESDLSNLEFSDSIFDLPQVSPVQVQADMTLFDDETGHPVGLPQSADPTLLPQSSTEFDLNNFDFSVSDPPDSEVGLSLETSVLPESISASPPQTSMPQDHSSTPIDREAFLTEDPEEFNAFSFDGLDDELFEPSPDLELDGRSPELEELLKKKRSHSREEHRPGRG
ncbi:MAG: hypothetical protein KME11_13440 [Timaviella obliquedivisa GSE-PSE-MK23-08B]|nr:hypothetical protein [Timaviella obliquedivisa GSE-PSE-MK23-08B]